MPAHWVATWAAAPQPTVPDDLPPAPFASDGLLLADTTLRQTVRVSLGGERIRLRFANTFGGAPLPLSEVTVARPAGGAAGVNEIEPGSARPVSFRGRPSIVVPVGGQATSDPLDFGLVAGSNLTITTRLDEGLAADAVTSHPGSRTTSYLMRGELTAAVDHWYLISGVEVRAPRAARALATLGDSLTDGRGSTTNGNDRWPDLLPPRDGVAVVNLGIGGNRVVADGLGPSALSRLDRDIFAQPGVRWLIMFEGINDIGTAEPSEPAQKQVAADLIAAYEEIVARTAREGIRVYGATLTPFGGNDGYDEGHREDARQAVNEWIRTSGRFAAVLDFDAAVRDPADPRRLRPGYDEGDHLHLNPAGYRAIAGCVPDRLFTG
jgi:lysophospholipase L1-like esterase